MAGTLETLETSTSFTIKGHWQIHYSRFFNYPSSTTSPRLRSVSKAKKILDKGNWISSSSTASMHLLTYHSLPEVVLVIKLRGKIYEEHFISKLQFSWPQVSCLAECPLRGGRVVFGCYRDHLGDIQKFAMRFLTSYDSQTFINTIKESLKNATNAELLSSNFGPEFSSQSKFFSSYGVNYRADLQPSYVHPVGNYTPPVQPSLNYGGMQYIYPEKITIAHGLEGTSSLPSSFTSLLADCCTETQQEQRKLPKEIDLDSQIWRYMTNPSFNYMLSKCRESYYEMGRDLSL